MPSNLAHAVVSVESNFNPKARGRAGEIGLMQIKLATARLMGYRGSKKGLYDPETNIKYGMKYLGKAHKLSGGKTCGTILALQCRPCGQAHEQDIVTLLLEGQEDHRLNRPQDRHIKIKRAPLAAPFAVSGHCAGIAGNLSPSSLSEAASRPDSRVPQCRKAAG